MIRAFVDDSGSGGDSPWYVLAGYSGTVCDWVGFEADWREALDSPPSIAYFKAVEAESLKEQFYGLSEHQRNSKIDALIKVIGQHTQRAIHVRVRQRLYNEILKPNVPEIWDDPYFFLFPAFISAVLTMEKYFGNQEPAELVFDNSERLDRRAKKLYGQLITFPQYAGRVLNVHFRSEKDFLPLQAADLLAWQIRRGFSVPKEPRRAHLDAATKCPREIPYSYILTKQDLLDALAVMQENARSFAASIGVPVDVLEKHLFRRKPKKKKKEKKKKP